MLSRTGSPHSEHKLVLTSVGQLVKGDDVFEVFIQQLHVNVVQLLRPITGDCSDSSCHTTGVSCLWLTIACWTVLVTHFDRRLAVGCTRHYKGVVRVMNSVYSCGHKWAALKTNKQWLVQSWCWIDWARHYGRSYQYLQQRASHRESDMLGR